MRFPNIRHDAVTVRLVAAKQPTAELVAAKQPAPVQPQMFLQRRAFVGTLKLSGHFEQDSQCTAPGRQSRYCAAPRHTKYCGLHQNSFRHFLVGLSCDGFT